MPVILATQEAEIRRIAVPSQPGQIVRETYLDKTHHKKRLAEEVRCRPRIQGQFGKGAGEEREEEGERRGGRGRERERERESNF
jgi:hypothetical protein